MSCSQEPTGIFKPFKAYNSVNKPFMVIFICGIALFGMVMIAEAARRIANRIGSDELLLVFLGLGFLYFSWYVGRFTFTPRLLIEKDYFFISDLFRKRKLYYDDILALAEFTRLMPMRHNRNRSLKVPVLAIRLRSGKLIQFILPSFQDNLACLNALHEASGVSIESLGVDPLGIDEWRREEKRTNIN